MDTQKPHFIAFERARWAGFREDVPVTLRQTDLARLRGHNDPVGLDEVEEVYLPLARLISLYVAASQRLYGVSSRFLGEPCPRIPYIIGVAGSVAVGKSTTSRLLQALLSAWKHHPKVEILTTDGFLFDNETLARRQLSARKGFPESYDLRALIACLTALKAGAELVEAPLYSHRTYDIVRDEVVRLEAPNIVIVEGLNVLQGAPRGRQKRLFVSDFFDFSVYVDAPTDAIKAWYLERFAYFASQARDDPQAYLHRFADIDNHTLMGRAEQIWHSINEVNLLKNILPYRDRARLILQKGRDHRIAQIHLRRG